MDVLQENFRNLFYLGIWRDENERFFLPLWIYRIMVYFIVTYFTITQTIELLRSSNVSESTECIFLTLSFFSFYAKWMNFLFRRKRFLELRNRFCTSICQPKCLEEKDILKKAAARSAAWTNLYFRLSVSCGITLVLRPFSRMGQGSLELPFKTYHPFDESNPFYFAVAFVIQGIGEIYGASINSCFDILCYGFLNLAAGQYDLCCYRLISSIKSEKLASSKKEWVEHHIYVQNIVHEIESFFIGPTVVFFVTTLFTVCTSIFVMSQLTFGGMEFLLTLVYFLAVLFEVFLYCICGTNLQQASQRITNAVYESDWTKLMPAKRNILPFIMMVGQKGSTVSFLGQCTLSLDTFVWIMKTSYGAFNLLQRVSFE